LTLSRWALKEAAASGAARERLHAGLDVAVAPESGSGNAPLISAAKLTNDYSQAGQTGYDGLES
jgi:hypothetical protein